MKTKSNLYLGIFLLSLGVLLLLHNFHIVEVSWEKVFRLWPFLLIFWGLKYIPMSERWRNITNIALLVLFYLLLFFGPQMHWRKPLGGLLPINIWYSGDKDEDEHETVRKITKGDEEQSDMYFSVEMNPAIKEAFMELNIAAADFKIKEPTDKLYELVLEDMPFPLQNEFDMQGDKAIIRIGPENKNTSYRVKVVANGELRLYAGIPWEININTGASALDLDFSPYIIRKMNILSGAAKIDLKLGDKSPQADVEIDTGASDLTIRVPARAGVEVEVNNVLSSKSLPGFVKVGKNLYRSENYDQAQSKIHLVINSAVSQLKIKKY